MSLITFRKTVSIVIGLLFALLFCGPQTLSAFLANVLLPVQLMPALLQTLIQPLPLFMAGLIFVVLLTLIFGRVYCSFLCPLGVLQDLIITGARRIGRSSGYAYSKPLNSLRYVLLALTILLLLSGIMMPVNLLDPYSITGRIFSGFLQPLLIWTYNLGILALKPFNIYLYPKETAFIPLPVLGMAMVFCLLIFYLAATRGRMYCNSLCPAGTLLGLLSRISLFQFVLNQNTCSACVRCETLCKAGCINAQNGTIDMSRCVGCFNCLDACSTSAVSYQRRRLRMGKDNWSPARRGFVIGGIAAVAGLLALNGKVRSWLQIPEAKADLPVTPPGSISPSRFTTACTACGLCVSVCPTQVLTPTFLDFGVTGLLQPKMNYEKSFCEYECNLCGRICPAGAILPLALPEKKLTQIGEADLLKDICVVFVDHRNCGACGEVCPTHAIRFTEKNNILYPEIDKQYCIGCGACQLACPTSPRSIVVHPRQVHQKAEKYLHPEKPAAPAKPAASDQDFPF